MGQRLSVQDIDPAAHQAVLGLEDYVRNTALERPLRELIKIRASQLNGCAFCLDMHHREARAAGEDQRRLDVLSAWREAPELYTARERAALTLTEAVTDIGRTASRTTCGSARESTSTRRRRSICSWPSPRSTYGTGWRSAPTSSYPIRTEGSHS